MRVTGMNTMRLPSQVIAADWSVMPAKRVLCRAFLRQNQYEIFAPEQVGNTADLIRQLHDSVTPAAPILIGFDFPIGLPSEYADRTGLSSFRSALAMFGKGVWRSFYEVSPSPTLQQPFYPPPCNRRGQHSRLRLVEALGVRRWDDLLRQCDRKTPTRRSASCLFFTLGGQQVGRAAAHGWQNVIVPNLETVKLWPFDGDLPALLAGNTTVVCEIYPAEAYNHFGIPPDAVARWSKRNRADRRSVASCLLRAAEKANCTLTSPARATIVEGFRSDDEFDAMAGLLFMLLVLAGSRPWSVPEDPSVRLVEGWILGMDRDIHPSDRVGPAERSISSASCSSPQPVS